MNPTRPTVLHLVSLALIIIGHLGLAETGTAGTVSAARSLPLPSDATIDDLILTRVVDYTVADTNHVIYGQDATGGVAIIASTANMANFLAGPDTILGNADDAVPGSRIDISGTTVSFNGLFEIGEIPFAQNWTYDGFIGIPSEIDMDIADMQDGSPLAESNEGMLVRLNDISFVQSGMFAGASNYSVTDGTLSTNVRVSTSAMPIVGTQIPVGVVDLVGILSQFDTTDPRNGGYDLLISFPSDIRPVPEPSTFTLICLGLLSLGYRRWKRT